MTEALWSGDFGNSYNERNAEIGTKRATFWGNLLARYPVESALEIGAGTGNNLQHLQRLIPHVLGVDVNERAVEEARCAGLRAIVAPATDIPYPDECWELVLSAGVLIHVSPEQLPRVMDEMHRLSSRYILTIEYDAENEIEVPYRGHAGALWKRPYGELMIDRFPSLVLRDTGFLAGPASETGWDDVVFWLWEKA